MWERWRAGDTLHAIAKLFDRNHTSVQQIFARTGGARGDLAGRHRWVVGALDCPIAAAGAEHGKPGDPSQRRSLQLSREHGGARRLGSGAASEAL
jgi:hypothetical protein